MSSTSGIVDEEKSNLKIKIYTGKVEEWPQWKMKFQAVLNGKGLLATLKSEKPGESATTEVKAAWQKKDQDIFFQLILHTSGAAGSLVEQFEEECSGQLAWKALIEKYEQKGSVGAVDLHKEMMKCRLGDNQDPDLFFALLESFQRRLKALKQIVTNEMLVAMILSKLPPGYDTICAILEAGGIDGSPFTYDQVKERIRAYYKRRIADGTDEEDEKDGAKALAVDARGGGREQKSPLCFGCGEAGHLKFQCPKRNKTGQGAGGGWRGNGNKHRGGGRGGRGGFGGRQQQQRGGGRGYGNWNRGPGNHKTPFKLRCYSCNREGHKAEDCPDKQMDKANTVTTGHGEEASIALAASDGTEVLLVKERNSSAGMKSTEEATRWVVDSGCTSHMTSSSEGLINIEWTEGKVVVADGKVLESTGVGSMDTIVRDQQGRVIKVSLHGVMIVPRLGRSLLSVRKITGRGGKVTFAGTEAHIEINGLSIPLKVRGNLYELECKGKPTGSEGSSKAHKKEQALAIRTGMDDWRVWHSKLGHTHVENLQKLGELDVGLPANLKSMIAAEKGTVCCDICEISKHTHASFRSIGRIRATKPFEIVHMDVFGPVDTQSLGGAVYGIVWTDDYSRWRVIKFMKAKSESLSKTKEFLADVSGLTKGQYKVRGLHSDNGGEFISREFKRYCKRKGIRQTYTGPRAPQQNGVAERANRIVLDMTRCLRLESGLGKELWGEISSTAVYIVNRIPTVALGGDTPYYRLFGKQATLSHMKVFGCQAYVQEERRGKLDAKAWRGILVGYDEYNRRCYRVYNPATKAVTRSVHVTFDERVLPAAREAERGVRTADVPGATIRIEEQGHDEEQRDVWFNLLPLGSNLMQDRGNQRRANEEAINRDQDVNPERPEEKEDLTSVGDDENPYQRTYNPSSRSERNWCQVEDCEIRGIHRAHTVVHYAYEAVEEVFGDPRTYDEAIKSADGDKWQKAAEEEIQSLVNNGTWILCEKPMGANIIGTRWIFKTKRDENGDISRRKARVVAQGFSQEPGKDYGETFAPVAEKTSVRTLAAVAAEEDWELDNMDVDTAFLNADIQEEIYIRQPPGFEQYGPNGEELVCKLKKSIYGLKQASRNWNHTIDQWLRGYGLKATKADPCVYTKRSQGDTLVILIWVDDIIIAGSNKRVVADFKAAISRRFKMKDLGPLEWILGVKIRRDRPRRRLEISQTAYIEQMLKRFGMEECKAVATPSEGVLNRMSSEDGGKPNKLYMSLVGSLLYAAMITRPDIAFAVQALGRHMQASGPEHMIAAKRVLRYLQGTKDLGLVYEYGPKNDGTPSHYIHGYSDADWGGDKDTRRSTTGYVFMLGTGALSWGSRLQATVALSSAEAEYMAACAAVQEAIHLRELMGDLGYKQDRATVIYEDNQGCIALSANPVFRKRTKHIDIRYHFIRERVTSGEVELRYIPTEEQLADLLTKGLPKPRTIMLRDRIMGYGK